jgi:hypothetical protein
MQPLALKNRRYWLPGCGLRAAGFIACFSCMSHLLKNKLWIPLIFPTLRHGVFLHFTSITHLLFL